MMLAKSVQLLGLKAVLFPSSWTWHGPACKNKAINEEIPGPLRMCQNVSKFPTSLYRREAHPSIHTIMGPFSGSFLLSKNPMRESPESQQDSDPENTLSRVLGVARGTSNTVEEGVALRHINRPCPLFRAGSAHVLSRLVDRVPCNQLLKVLCFPKGMKWDLVWDRALRNRVCP